MLALALALLASAPRPAAVGGADLVDVTALLPDAVLDVRYATPRNFTGQPLYPVARCLLRRDAAQRLARAAGRLAAQGYRLRLYDCYRPLSVQRRMWASFPRRGFVADPRTGSNHNRGAAVDVGLSGPDGRELEMPTGYDAFVPAARARAVAGIPAEARRRRDRLRAAMEAEGFRVNPMEWWHFDGPGAGRLPVLDVPLEAVEARR